MPMVVNGYKAKIRAKKQTKTALKVPMKKNITMAIEIMDTSMNEPFSYMRYGSKLTCLSGLLLGRKWFEPQESGILKTFAKCW
tara:strand:- start:134 stop:382 length:249 start_codon:yes stop_codon:yes gene_type:complete